MKSLREILEPKPQGEKDFVKKHKVEKVADKNGNKDDVFTGSNVKKAEYPTQNASAYEEVEQVDEATKEEMRALLAKNTTGKTVTKVPEGPRDPTLSGTYRMAGRWMGKNLGNGQTPSEKSYQKTHLKTFAKEAVNEEVTNEDYSDIESGSYETHHKRCGKAINDLKSHLDNHKKWSKSKRGSEEIKNLSRTLEDMAQQFAHTADWMKPMKANKDT